MVKLASFTGTGIMRNVDANCWSLKVPLWLITASDHIGLHRTTSDHIWPHLGKS